MKRDEREREMAIKSRFDCARRRFIRSFARIQYRRRTKEERDAKSPDPNPRRATGRRRRKRKLHVESTKRGGVKGNGDFASTTRRHHRLGNETAKVPSFFGVLFDFLERKPQK